MCEVFSLLAIRSPLVKVAACHIFTPLVLIYGSSGVGFAHTKKERCVTNEIENSSEIDL